MGDLANRVSGKHSNGLQSCPDTYQPPTLNDQAQESCQALDEMAAAPSHLPPSLPGVYVHYRAKAGDDPEYHHAGDQNALAVNFLGYGAHTETGEHFAVYVKLNGPNEGKIAIRPRYGPAGWDTPAPAGPRYLRVDDDILDGDQIKQNMDRYSWHPKEPT